MPWFDSQTGHVHNREHRHPRSQAPRQEKVALKKDFETGLKTNDFWLSSILKAIKYNQNIEKVTYLNSIVDSITLNEIAKLAKQLLDDQYFESVSYLSE